MFNFRSKVLFVSAVIGTLYVFYLISYFIGGTASAGSTEEAIGTGLATVLVAPHMFMVFLAVIFNWIGFAMNKKWAAITCGVLYSVAGFLFMLYIMFVIPCIVLSFVGVAQVGKINAKKNAQTIETI